MSVYLVQVLVTNIKQNFSVSMTLMPNEADTGLCAKIQSKREALSEKVHM